jgi:hypothetical protein
MIKTFLQAFFLIGLFAVPAMAADPPSQIFPPANCLEGTKMMFAWHKGAASTSCLTGQEVLSLAIPGGCSEGQNVVYRPDGFKCEPKKDVDTDYPACPDGQYVTTAMGANGVEMVCKAAPMRTLPNCGTGKALTSADGTNFTCVNVQSRLTIPACAANQVLTYSSSSFSCKAIVAPGDIPPCGNNQVTRYDGSSFTCVNASGGSGNMVAGYTSGGSYATSCAKAISNVKGWGNLTCTQSGKYFSAGCPAGSTTRITGFSPGYDGGEGNYQRSDVTFYGCVTD